MAFQTRTTAVRMGASKGDMSDNWQTPNVMDSLPVRDEKALRKQYLGNRAGRTSHSTLREQVAYPPPKAMWATPNAFDANNIVRKPDERSDAANKGGCSNLREQVHNCGPQWPTPAVKDVTGGPYKTEVKDGRFVSYHNNTVENPTPYGANLKDAVTCQWATPRSGKTTSENPDNWQKRNDAGEVSTMPLTCQVQVWPSPTASTGGSEPEGSTGRKLVTVCGAKLNPRWVETLMNLPIGWTRPGCTDPCNPCDPTRDRSEDTKVDNRTDELRLLGNGVVPATAEIAFRTLFARLTPRPRASN
jgi:hypothetical protein